VLVDNLLPESYIAILLATGESDALCGAVSPACVVTVDNIAASFASDGAANLALPAESRNTNRDAVCDDVELCGFVNAAWVDNAEVTAST
jgi:uncharacterized protein YsxB (DUF464 family)